MLSSDQLRVELRRAGIANAAIDAIWPQWWSADADASISATAELTFTVARRLGLAPQALLEGQTEFIWRDETKYKRLSAQASDEEAALSSFGCAVGRAVVQGVAPGTAGKFAASEIRQSFLEAGGRPDLESLLMLCWDIGIPVLFLRVFPLQQKRMHAMSVPVRQRAVILLARHSAYSAPVAFTLAHELAHVMLGHLDEGAALVDLEDPLTSSESDDPEEAAADRFALELLTGQPSPEVISDTSEFSATQLARAVMTQAPGLGIDPGVLAMCAGHTTGMWERAYGALKLIPPGEQDVPAAINQLAARQVDWSNLSSDAQDYLQTIMDLAPADV